MSDEPATGPVSDQQRTREGHAPNDTWYPRQPSMYGFGGQMQQDMMYPQQEMMYLQQDLMYPQQEMMYLQQDMMYPQQDMMYPQEMGSGPTAAMYASAAYAYPHRGSAYPVRPLGKRISTSARNVDAGRQGLTERGTRWPLDRPLSVSHINAALIPAGIEYWLASLRRYCDPSRLRFMRTVVLTDWVDRRQIPRMGMPVEVGGRQSVINAASQCDVMLISDPGANASQVCQWLLEAKPSVTVFVAHGDGDYTRDRLSGIGPAVDHIVAVTEHVRREVCEGWPVSMILNGVDPHRLVMTQPRQESRHQLGFAKEDFVVGFVGRFSEEKNPQLVIEAVAQLPPRYKALLIGHGYMRSALIEQCLELLPGRFVLLEGDGDLGDLYASMNAFVMPSRLEGYGLVAMEAMMCGVPVIGTPFGMIADLVTDQVDGVVVEPKADAIAKAAFKLGEHRRFCRAVAAGGRRLANQTGFASQMARQYEQLLSELWLESIGIQDADR